MRAATIALVAAAAMALPGLSSAFDCAQIDATTEQAYQDLRSAMRKEITKSPGDGGAFTPPSAPSEIGCASQIYDAFGGFGGLSFGGAVDAIIAAQVNRACDRARERYSDEMERLGT